MEGTTKKPLNLLLGAAAIGIYFAIANLFTYLSYKAIPDWIQFNPKDQNEIMAYLSTAELVTSVLLLIIVFIAYRAVKKHFSREKTVLTGRGALKCTGAGLAIFGSSFLIAEVCRFDVSSGAAGGIGPIDLLVMFITSAFFAPVIEELLFRGIVFRLFSRFKAGWFAVILSAACFAVYHWDLVQGIFAFIMGIVFAYAYSETNNIKYPMLIHAVNNGFVVFTNYVLPEGVRIYANWFGVAVMAAMLVYVIFNRKKRTEN